MTSVACVVLDTLRVDFFDEYFDWLPGAKFSNTYSTSHGTIQAHGSLFTGLYPSEHGAGAKSPTLDVSEPLLAEELSQRGVATFAHSSNPYVSPAFNFHRGFDSFSGNYRVKQMFDSVFDWEEISDSDTGQFRKYAQGLWGSLKSGDPVESLRQGLLLKAQGEGWWTPTDKGAIETLDWLESRQYQDPEFIFINLMEAHSPYLQIPPRYTDGIAGEMVPHNPNIEQLFNPPEAQPTRDAYEASIQYLSDIYKQIFDILSSSVDIVITMADHGEMLGENGLWGHNLGVHPHLVKVPLVLSGDLDDGISNNSRLVSTVDVHQTILDIFGRDSQQSRGVSLLSSETRDNALTEYTGLPNELVERYKGSTPIERYDTTWRGIATQSAYGYETLEGWQTIGEDVNSLTEKLDDQVEDLSVRTKNSEVLSDSTKKRLEDLGYA